MNKHKVLVVDDDDKVLNALKREINSFNIAERLDLYFFNSPQNALDFMSFNKDITLVITDQRMPRMRGDELLLKMRKNTPDSSAILLSAYTDIDAITKSIGTGLVSFIQKPWDSSHLMNEINRGVELYTMKRIKKKYIQVVNKELCVNGKFQSSLMRKGLPRHEQLDFTVRTVTLPHYYSSSDFYTVIKIDSNRFLYLLADGDGPGIKSSTKTVILRTLVSEFFEETGDLRMVSPGNLLNYLNRKLYRHIGHEYGETIQCCALLLDLEFMNITAAGGGRGVPIIFRSPVSIPIEVSGPSLGIHKDYEYEESMTGMRYEDRVLMYSDGLSSIQERYGILHRLMMKHCMKESFVNEFMDDLNRLMKGRSVFDDITLLSIKVKAPQ